MAPGRPRLSPGLPARGRHRTGRATQLAVAAVGLGLGLIKQLTFVRRGTSVAPEEFGPRWREETLAALADRPADARPFRLVHCVVRPGSATPAWDGVAIAWSGAAGPAPGSVLDGRGTAVTVEERTVSGQEWLEDRWRQGGGVELGLVLIGLIEAAGHLTRERFKDYWWDKHRPLANRLVPNDVEPVAYVHNYVADDDFRWAGVGELYERSLDTARRRGAWFESEAAGPLVADEERFLVRATRQVLVTDGEVLVGPCT